MNKKEIGRRIARSLGVRRISCAELGRALGVTRCAIAHWCCGRYLPSLIHQKELLNYLAEKDESSEESPVILLRASDFTSFNEKNKKQKQLLIKNNKKVKEKA